MLVKYYSIYDKVAEEYGPVFSAKNDKVALRMFNQFMQSKASEIDNEFDFELFYVFSFDSEHAVVYPDGFYPLEVKNEDKESKDVGSV